MNGKGMGCATKGGGAVEKGARNKMMTTTSKTTGPVMMQTGGAVKAGMHRMPDGKMMKDSAHKSMSSRKKA